MSKSVPKILIFDFDGVLADTLGDMLGFAREVCGQLGHHCYPTQEDLNSLEHMSFDSYAHQLRIPEEKIPEFTGRMFRLFTSRQQPPDIFPGLKQVIQQLACQASIGIVTGNTRRLVRKFLDHHGLASDIEFVIAVEEPGTRSEKIQNAARRLGPIGSQVFVIGDAVSDIYAAKHAGAKSIAVTWGHQSQEKLALASPDYLVHSPEELLLILSRTQDLSSSPTA
jgi:phosphoglycolate phosphatase